MLVLGIAICGDIKVYLYTQDYCGENDSNTVQ